MDLLRSPWVCRDLTIRLAEAYGYCWGVERAVQMAYEARRQFPGHKVHVTNEIIHNPAVNQVRHCWLLRRQECAEAPALVSQLQLWRRAACAWQCCVSSVRHAAARSSPLPVQRLKEMDINIIELTEQGKDFSTVACEDVVILPAFGASYSEMKLLNDRRVHIVDTTCPWVRLLVRHGCCAEISGCHTHRWHAAPACWLILEQVPTRT